MKMRRAARKALAVPLMIGGAVLFLTIGTANVFAASSSVPVTSSGPHEHEFVVCSPNPIEAGQPCTITFTDAIHKGEPFKPAQGVLQRQSDLGWNAFRRARTRRRSARTASRLARSPRVPTSAATRTTTRRSSPPSSLSENNQKHHTTVTIACSTTTNTSAVIPAGTSSPPGIGWLLAGIGLGAALVAVYALRIRRWFAPRRLAARQPE